MSNIIEKAFDASKKIVRSIFKGTPNLLTATDLNRQFEALKSQIDSVEENQRVISDLSVDMYVDYTRMSSGALITKLKVTKVIAKGCAFSPTIDPKVLENRPAVKGVNYICLVAKKKVVTYEDDFLHEIAGAKFEDGTSLPAANQEVYYDEKLVIEPDRVPENCICVLGKFEIPDSSSKGQYEYRHDIVVSKYWTSSPYEYDFQKLTKNPMEQFGTLDMAIGTLIRAISNKGNLYKGKCLIEVNNTECGSWNAIVTGRSLHCHIEVDKGFSSFMTFGYITLEDFDKWHFINKETPIRRDINIRMSKGSETLVLSGNQFWDASFSPKFVYSPIIATKEDGSYEETYRKESGNFNNNVGRFGYTGGKNLDEWKLENFKMIIEFTAMLTCEYGGEYLGYVSK